MQRLPWSPPLPSPPQGAQIVPNRGPIRKHNRKTWIFYFLLYGRWADLDGWKWVVINVGVILNIPASHSENFFFDNFGSWVGDHSARPQGAIRILTFHDTFSQLFARTGSLRELRLRSYRGVARNFDPNPMGSLPTPKQLKKINSKIYLVD